MKILITNDDGYQAPGLRALYDVLSTVADVSVIAPEGERSAVALGITLTDILRVWPIDNGKLEGHYINGTPADCVKIGCGQLLDEMPDFIFSGINTGSNAGLNANYSGTVAGAVEGAMMGIPSVAISLASFKYRDFRGACRSALRILELLQEFPLQRYELLNVNVPPLPPEELKGLRITRVSHSAYREVFDRRTDARDREYYWMGGVWKDFDKVEDGDREITESGYVAVTPLTVDWTASETVDRMRRAGWEGPLDGGRK